jgi:hypothetical protein
MQLWLKVVSDLPDGDLGVDGFLAEMARHGNPVVTVTHVVQAAELDQA